MHSISYYSFEDRGRPPLLTCSRHLDTCPIYVNCAGIMNANWQFKTVNTEGREDFYLIYVKEGELSVSVNGETKQAKESDLIIFPPNTPYEYSHKGKERLSYFWTHFTGSYAMCMLKKFHLYPLPFKANIPKNPVSADYRIQKIFDLYTAGGIYRDEEIALAFNSLVLDFAKSVNMDENPKGRLSSSLKYIHSHYTASIEVKDLAQMEKLSVSRYSAIFKEYFGIAPYAYITNLRLKSACEMLINSELSVSEISDILGFQNSFFFSKLFKSHLQLSPLQYRKNFGYTVK